MSNVSLRPGGTGPIGDPLGGAPQAAAAGSAAREAAAETLRLGSRGPAVTELQTQLRALGLVTGPIDGVFGRQTQRAVLEFQRARGLVADGIAGPKTRSALAEAVDGLAVDQGLAVPLRLGARGPAVGRLQSRLIALGFDPGPADGVFGKKTEAALKQFQRSVGLKADGIAGPRTFAALDAAGAAPPATKAWCESDGITPGNVYATVNGVHKLLAKDGIKAFLLDGGRYVAWSTPDGAGGYENEGQGLNVFDTRTGQTRKIMSEYFPVDGVTSVRTSDGRTAFLVAMRDGGAGFPHAAIVDPTRGEVARFARATLVAGGGDRATVELHANPDDPAQVTGMGSVDLRRALDGPVIENPRSPP